MGYGQEGQTERARVDGAAECGNESVPPWLRDAYRAVHHEVALYLRTAIAFALEPRRTAQAWARGQFQALNPFAYMLNSLAAIGLARAVYQRVAGLPDLPLSFDVYQTVSPFLAVLVNGALVHGLFRWSGSRRPLSASLAIGIFSAYGAPTLLMILLTPILMDMSVIVFARGMGDIAAAGPMFDRRMLLYSQAPHIVGLATIVVHVSALAGLHGTSRRRSLLLLLTPPMLLFVVVLVAAIVLRFVLRSKGAP